MRAKVGKIFPTSGKCKTLDNDFMELLVKSGLKPSCGSNKTSNTSGIAWNNNSFWWLINYDLSGKQNHKLEDLIESEKDDIMFECLNTNGYQGMEYQVGCRQDCTDCEYNNLLYLDEDDEPENVFTFSNNGLLEVFIPKIENVEKIKENINIKLYKNEIIKI